MESLLGSEEVWNGLLILAMGIVGWVGKTAWAEKRAKAWELLALKALDAGIMWVYQHDVRPYKANRAPGEKMSDEMAAELRAKAWKKGVEYGAADGVDVKRVIGEQYLDMVIENRVGLHRKANTI